MNRDSAVIVTSALIFGLLFSSIGLASEKLYVAVVDFEIGPDISLDGKGAAQTFMHSLSQTKQYTLMERILLRKVLDEQVLSSSEHVSDQARANKVGELYGVKAIVTGTVVKFADKLSVTVQLLDATTGEILKSGQVMSPASELGLLPTKGFPELAGQLAGRQQAVVQASVYPLTVESSPPADKIRILNIAPVYHDGMKLAAGRYHIEVQKQGYATDRRWVELTKSQHLFKVQLTEDITAAAEEGYEQQADPIQGVGYAESAQAPGYTEWQKANYFFKRRKLNKAVHWLVRSAKLGNEDAREKILQIKHKQRYKYLLKKHLW